MATIGGGSVGQGVRGALMGHIDAVERGLRHALLLVVLLLSSFPVALVVAGPGSIAYAACGAPSHPAPDTSTPYQADYYIPNPVVSSGVPVVVDMAVYGPPHGATPPTVRNVETLNGDYSTAGTWNVALACTVDSNKSQQWDYLGTWTPPTVTQPTRYLLAMTFVFQNHTNLIYFGHVLDSPMPVPTEYAHWDNELTGIPSQSANNAYNVFHGATTVHAISVWNFLGDPSQTPSFLDIAMVNGDDATLRPAFMAVGNAGHVPLPYLDPAAPNGSVARSTFPFTQNGYKTTTIAQSATITVERDDGPNNKIGSVQYHYLVTAQFPLTLYNGPATNPVAQITGGHWVLDSGYSGNVHDGASVYPYGDAGLGNGLTFYANPATLTGTPLGSGAARLRTFMVNPTTVADSTFMIYHIVMTAHDPAQRTACPTTAVKPDPNSAGGVTVDVAGLCPGTRYDTVTVADYALPGGTFDKYAYDILSDNINGSFITGGTPPATDTPTPLPTNTALPTVTPTDLPTATPLPNVGALPTATPYGQGGPGGPPAPFPVGPSLPVSLPPSNPAGNLIVHDNDPNAYAWARVLPGDDGAAVGAGSLSASAWNAPPAGGNRPGGQQVNLTWQAGRLLRLLPAASEHPDMMPMTVNDPVNGAWARVYPSLVTSTSYALSQVGEKTSYCGPGPVKTYPAQDKGAYPNEVNPTNPVGDTLLAWASPDAPGPWKAGVMRCEIAPLVAGGGSSTVPIAITTHQTFSYVARFWRVGPPPPRRFGWPRAYCAMGSAAQTAPTPPRLAQSSPGLIPSSPTGACDGGHVGWDDIQGSVNKWAMGFAGGGTVTGVQVAPDPALDDPLSQFTVQDITVHVDVVRFLNVTVLFKREVG